METQLREPVKHLDEGGHMLAVRVPGELLRQLDAWAIGERRTRSQLIRNILTDAVEQENR